jgi:hypothetical protein
MLEKHHLEIKLPRSLSETHAFTKKTMQHLFYVHCRIHVEICVKEKQNLEDLAKEYAMAWWKYYENKNWKRRVPPENLPSIPSLSAMQHARENVSRPMKAKHRCGITKLL